MSDLYDLSPPDIPGLRGRPFGGADDADGLLAVRLVCAAHDGFDPLSSVETLPTHDELARELATATESGEQERAIIAEIDSRVAGYNRIYDWPESDGTYVWLTVGWVLPTWRGRGLGTALLRWSERRIRQLAADLPGRWEFAANASSTETEATALLLDNGYAAGYTVIEMGLDWDAFLAAQDTGVFPKSPVSPGGPVILPGRVGDAGLIAASVREAYLDEYEGGRYSEELDLAAYAAELAGERYDPSLWQVAWDGDDVVGQVLPVIERGRAEIEEVSVRPGWRRRGMARALLSAALLQLHGRGMDVVRLHTVAEFQTRAVDLYRATGFRVLKEFPRYRKPA